MNRAIRAHGNSAEYTPVFLVLFLYFLATGASGWIAWVVAGITFCRVLHPLSILIAPDLNAIYPPRSVAAVGTYLGGLALGVVPLIRALNGRPMQSQGRAQNRYRSVNLASAHWEYRNGFAASG